MKGMKERYLKILTKTEIKEIYDIYTAVDFPPAELKSWNTLSAGYDSGYYSGYGYYENDSLLAYAFLVRIDGGEESTYILDYYAVLEDMRGKGIGSEMLDIIREKINAALFCEAEDPDYAETEKERNDRIRRISFYKKNGFTDTGVRSRIFGSDFVNLELPAGKLHDRQSVIQITGEMYRMYLNDHMYRKQIIFKKP